MAFHKFVEENVEMKKQLDVYIKEKTQDLKRAIIKRKDVVNGINVFVLRQHCPVDVVKDLAFQIKGEFPTSAVFIGATEFDSKPALTLMLTDDLVATGLSASTIVREAAKNIQGGGGGQSHFATAGGKNLEGLTKAFDEIYTAVTK